MNLFPLLTLLLLMATTNTFQSVQKGLFEEAIDIGSPQKKGNTLYQASNQTYTLSGAGTNMWGSRDEFHYAYKKIKGDFILRARVEFVGEGVDPHRKIGWSIRPNLTPSGKHVSASIHGDGLTSLQFRKTEGGVTEEITSSNKAPDVVQLERKGSTYLMSTAQFGDEFTTVILEGMELPDELYAGIFICSHNPDIIEKAQFRNVRIVKPAPEDFVPYQDYVGSNLEVMEVETGYRKILHQAPNSIQAPNWRVDGNDLIYNSDGKLYNFNLETQIPTELNTGFATQNNNDHVLTFDGETIGISHHSEEDGGLSIVYYLPSSGGTPVRVTSKGPSYFHGWSPDGLQLVYTGGRDDVYNIYKVPKSGGEEMQLTNTPALDDGPEYAPDGSYIYFNSTRSGTMQIWRMKPDGSNPEQLTFDSYNNWFPHISPDGKQMVILSFLPDVDPTDHPFYRQVYLRLMSVDGGKPKVIGYVYGGQGTINVPSWSPDGKKISFVSNTDF